MSRKSPDVRATAVPTLIDVAGVASVSLITVSRILGRPRGAQAGRAAGYQPQLGLTGYDLRQGEVLLAAAPEHRTCGSRTAWLRQLRCVIFHVV
jgi:hypothetical protein